MSLTIFYTDLARETELLDVAPIDLLHGMSKCFADDMPDFFMSSEVRDQCLDAEYIWVSETGSSGQNSLTTSMKITPTVSPYLQRTTIIDRVRV